MADLIGFVRKPHLYVLSSGFNPAIDNRLREPNTIGIRVVSERKTGLLNTNQPVTTPTKNRGAGRSTSFLTDYYFRVHVNPSEINVGNLLSTQLKTVEVWNARFDQNTLTSISEVDTDGITLSGQASPPVVYQSLQSRLYTVNIATDGPSVINAKFGFNFSLESYVPSLVLTGVRILAWFPRPNWATPLTERWEWLTNVITSRNRKEQRIKLREQPRRQLEYTLLVKNNKERQLVENLLFAWQSRVFGLPIWTDQQAISMALVPGDLTISCVTFSRDYYAGGLIGLFNDVDFEIGTVQQVNADSVQIVTPLTKSWGIGTKVVPLRTARMSSKQSFVRHTDTVLGMTVQFKLDEGDNRIPVVETPDYRSYAVLEVKPNWAKEISSDYERDLTLIDFIVGKVLGDDTSGVSSIKHTYHWLAKTREEINTLRAFIFARYGKLVPLWVPTFTKDFIVTDLIASSSTVMFIENVSYTRNITQGVQRRDIRIQLVDGTIFYRRILASTEVGELERLVFDSQLGVLVNVADIHSVSYMSLCRLEADSVEVSWITDSVMSVSASIRTIRDDV